MSSRKRKVMPADAEEATSPSKAAYGKGRYRLCSISGCTKQVQQGGVCCKHGAKTTRAKCSHNGCANVAKRGGLCRKHGAFELETCSHDGCKRVVKSKIGHLCEIHASPRENDFKATPAATNSSKKVVRGALQICAYEGCSTRASKGGGGFCSSHDAATKFMISDPSYANDVMNLQIPDPSYASDVVNLQSFCNQKGDANEATDGGGGGGVCISHGNIECSNVTQGTKKKLCNHERCRNKAVYDGICVAHGAMQRVYARNHPGGPDNNKVDACWTEEIQDVHSNAEGGGGGDNTGQLDFLCDYYEDMYEQLT